MAGLRDGELETAAEMSAALARGEVTSPELAERALRRARTWQPSINAFSQIWEDAVASLPVGGRVPMFVKDLFDVAGRETTGCCAAYRGNVAATDAAVITRVRDGFALLGKTNQHELAAGGTNLVSACGRTGNPWDPARITGGSSGGSAAAVAAGIVPVALGSDTGGSIRIPASLCGSFGLKPTTGRLPIGGLMPLAPSMDCPGPMAATAGDLELLFRAMAGPDEGEGSARHPPFRIALLEAFFADAVHQDVQGLLDATAGVLEGADVQVGSVDGRGIEWAQDTWLDECCPEFAQAHPLLKDPDRRSLVARQPREWLERGERLSPEQRAESGRRRQEVARWYRDRLSDFDAVLVPTTPYPAPRADQETVELGGDRSVEIAQVGPGFLTRWVNLAGLPAVNLPAGRSSNGMPIGISLVGQPGGDETLLALARLWEAAAGYRPERPPLPAA